MARKIRGFERVLDVPSLAAVAFGEIASSVYFALGVVALFALGFTPWVLLLVGCRLRARRALVRGGDGGAPAGRRRRALRRARVQRPGRIPGRLGALPRLPDRRRARGALRAALRRDGGRLGRDHARAVGRGGRGRRPRGARRGAALPPHEHVHGRDDRRRDRLRDADGALGARDRVPLRARRPGRGARPRDGADLEPRSRSPSRSRRSPTPGSRRSRTWPPRRASRDARCRAASSRGSGPPSS